MIKRVFEWLTIGSMLAGAILGLIFVHNSLTMQLNPSVLETFVMGILIFCGITFVGNLPAMVYYMMTEEYAGVNDPFSPIDENQDGAGI